jgi:hypothetical protein
MIVLIKKRMLKDFWLIFELNLELEKLDLEIAMKGIRNC